MGKFEYSKPGYSRQGRWKADTAPNSRIHTAEAARISRIRTPEPASNFSITPGVGVPSQFQLALIHHVLQLELVFQLHRTQMSDKFNFAILERDGVALRKWEQDRWAVV